jgi:hypothetical protein
MQFEYKLLKFKPAFWSETVRHEEVEAELNELGAQGWELCGMFGTNSSHGMTKECIFTFKRCRG